MRLLKKSLGTIAAAALVLSGIVLGVSSASQDAEAADAADFDPGYIVSDEQFYDGDAMSAAEVQTFLSEKGSSCTYNCLKSYKMTTNTVAATSRCDTYQGATNESAAQIIAKVGQACNISQKTLLVLLEKETSLVTIADPGPADWRYDRAMGYYCPDNPDQPGWCHPDYGGFFNQVYNAASQYQRYKQTPDDWNYRAGRTNSILYHPNSSCGSKSVYIQNQATAGLYIYTPYTPNQASLNNLYGTGDSCSSYGNRNFWRLWTDWFGSPTGEMTDSSASNPKMQLDSVQVNSDGTVTLKGWAFDPDVPTSSLRVHVYVDGKAHKSISADVTRADVNKAYSELDTDSVGFNVTIGKLSTGTHEIQVYAINQGEGGNTMRTAEVTVNGPSMSPDMNLETAKANSDGTVTLKGWAFDPDVPTSSIRVHIYVDGKAYKSLSADELRTDVNNAKDRLDTDEVGFSYTTGKLSDGEHEIQVYAINQGEGSNTVRTADVTVKASANNPKAHLDEATLNEDSTVTLRGWAFDADQPTSSIRVHVYINDEAHKSLGADLSRPDVNKAYTELQNDSVGFQYTTPSLDPGTYKFTLYAINVDSGSNTVFGATTVVVSESGAAIALKTGDASTSSETSNEALTILPASEDQAAEVPSEDEDAVVTVVGEPVASEEPVEPVVEPAADTDSTEHPSVDGAADAPSETDEPGASTDVPEQPGVMSEPDASDEDSVLTVVPPAAEDAEQSAAADAADVGDLAVTGTGPLNAMPIIGIVALGVAVGLGLLYFARRQRDSDLDEAI